MKHSFTILALFVFILLNCSYKSEKTTKIVNDDRKKNPYSIKKEDFNLLKGFVNRNGYESLNQNGRNRKSVELKSEKLGKIFCYSEFNTIEKIDIQFINDHKTGQSYTLEKNRDTVQLYLFSSRTVLDEDLARMHSDFEALILFLKNYSIVFKQKNDIEFIIEGTYNKIGDAVYIGHKPCDNWPFYDKIHPYKLMVELKISQKETCFKNGLNKRTLLETINNEGVLVYKLIENHRTRQCPSINYLIYTDKPQCIIQYPDCGMSDTFKLNADRYVNNFVYNNFILNQNATDTITLRTEITNVLPVGWGILYKCTFMNRALYPKVFINNETIAGVSVGSEGLNENIDFLQPGTICYMTFVKTKKRKETPYLPAGTTGICDTQDTLWNIISIKQQLGN